MKMTLRQTKKEVFEIAGKAYTETTYKLGDYYKVYVETETNEDGETTMTKINVDIVMGRERAYKNFIFNVLAGVDCVTNKFRFGIPSRNYYAKNASEQQKINDNYQNAAEAVKILEKNFG